MSQSKLQIKSAFAPDRRSLMITGGALFGWAFAPRFAHAAGNRDARFVTIILRGALDGLSAVPPIADPAYAGLRGPIALTRDGDHPAIPLDGFFALHPAMPNFARLYRARQALVVHAAATPYRDRSHFDGQDVLESGQPVPGRTGSGWLNRALSALPAGARVGSGKGVGVGSTIPLVMTGPAPVLGWAPPGLPPAQDGLAQRVLALYGEQDARLGAALHEGLTARAIAMRDGATRMGAAGPAYVMERAASGAARLLAGEDGPRVAALAFGGWDTHANEGAATGQLAHVLAGLDAAFAAFEQGLGPAWKDTTILVATEFGRTARVNGTGGTDHGTGTVAFLVGGAVKGGRVIADWPGLKEHQLYQDRDLAPTTDLRAVAKGVLAGQFGLSDAVLGTKVFPDSAAVKPMQNLIAV